MKCPKPECGYLQTHVRWTRPDASLRAVRRGLECCGCGHRFTTVEVPEAARSSFEEALVRSILSTREGAAGP